VVQNFIIKALKIRFISFNLSSLEKAVLEDSKFFF